MHKKFDENLEDDPKKLGRKPKSKSNIINIINISKKKRKYIKKEKK